MINQNYKMILSLICIKSFLLKLFFYICHKLMYVKHDLCILSDIICKSIN